MTSIENLAQAPSLLVVTDFDGTLADLNPDPYAVFGRPESLEALRRLAALPNTTVAVLSGRDMARLRQLCDLDAPVVFAGSHGAESELGVPITAEQQATLDHISAQLLPIAAEYPGMIVEEKPFQRVAHVAKLDEATRQRALGLADAIDHGSAHKKYGKHIIEYSVTDINKGTWLAAEITHLYPSRALFIGDDATDEDGFAALRPQDLGVKVGDGKTRASMRIPDTAAVGKLLMGLAEARESYLS